MLLASSFALLLLFLQSDNLNSYSLFALRDFNIRFILSSPIELYHHLVLYESSRHSANSCLGVTIKDLTHKIITLRIPKSNKLNVL